MLQHITNLFERTIANVDWSKVTNIITEFRDVEFDVRFASYFEDIPYSKKHYFLTENDVPVYEIIRYKNAKGDIYNITCGDATVAADGVDSMMKYIIKNEFKKRKIKPKTTSNKTMIWAKK